METVYYKITNKEENHNGYQYQNGLNILDKPFEKIGSCVEGGLYFTDIVNIFKFLAYGCFLREITLSSKSQWVRDPDGDKFRADMIILGTRYELANPETFKMLIEKGANI